MNAVYAITYSACFYVLRCLLAEDAPATAGLMYPVTVLAPEGTIVNARPPAAVAGGNVETSASASWMCCCGRWRRLRRSACLRRATAP